MVLITALTSSFSSTPHALSLLHRTNSDSALHTSAMNPNPQDPFGVNQQMGRGPPQRNGEFVAFRPPRLPNDQSDHFIFPSFILLCYPEYPQSNSSYLQVSAPTLISLAQEIQFPSECISLCLYLKR